MQTIRTSGPQTQPVIRPVTGLRDINGVALTLDCDVIVDHLRGWKSRTPYRASPSAYRAKLVGIGDPGLPGNNILKVRPHGSTYISSSGPEQVEVVMFDDYEWLGAETAAAQEQLRLGRDLTECRFGWFYFEEFQRTATSLYLAVQKAKVTAADGQKVRAEGICAYMEGVSSSDCPYEYGTSVADLWQFGWFAARMGRT